jgi:hypothetical protein
MSKVIIDDVLRAKLNGLNEQVEFYDESGCKLGHFLPAEMYQDLLNAWVEKVFTKEELQRAEHETGGRPLAEIWKGLGRK